MFFRLPRNPIVHAEVALVENGVGYKWGTSLLVLTAGCITLNARLIKIML